MKLKEYIQYELLLIFNDVSIDNGTKSSLKKMFENCVQKYADVQDAASFTWRIYIVHCPNGFTFKEFVNKYYGDVIYNYGYSGTAVFYGHTEHSTTKTVKSKLEEPQRKPWQHTLLKKQCMTPKEKIYK